MIIHRSTGGGFATLIFISFSILVFSTTMVPAQKAVNLPGKRALVFDERLSALRSRPDSKAALLQRLRRGRALGITGAATSRDGTRYFRVAVSRNRRGWIEAGAVVQPGKKADAVKLLTLIEETKDDFTRAKLARMCADEFRLPTVAPRALLLLGEAAERAARKLSDEAGRRIGEATEEHGRRNYYLNYPGLDRYNRIRIIFDFDEASHRLVYRGEAYHELIRRYPRAPEAAVAKSRIEMLE